MRKMVAFYLRSGEHTLTLTTTSVSSSTHATTQMTAFARKVETGGRGGLHNHDLVMQDAMQPGAVERLLRDARCAMFAYVERVMCGSLPPGWRVVRAGARTTAVPPLALNVAPLPAAVPVAACRPPLHAAVGAVAMDAAAARCAVAMQLHNHTARCRKGGHAGTDDDCALDAVRRPHPATSYHEGVLLARLDMPTMVFHIPAVSLALACNNASYLFAEQSKHALKVYKYEQAVLNGTAQPGNRPALLSIEDASCEASEYASKYTGKYDHAPRSADAMATAAASAQVRSPLHTQPTGHYNNCLVLLLSLLCIVAKHSPFRAVHISGSARGNVVEPRATRNAWRGRAQDRAHGHQPADRLVGVLIALCRVHAAGRQGHRVLVSDGTISDVAVRRGATPGVRRRAFR